MDVGGGGGGRGKRKKERNENRKGVGGVGENRFPIRCRGEEEGKSHGAWTKGNVTGVHSAIFRDRNHGCTQARVGYL